METALSGAGGSRAPLGAGDSVLGCCRETWVPFSGEALGRSLSSREQEAFIRVRKGTSLAGFLAVAAKSLCPPAGIMKSRGGGMTPAPPSFQTLPHEVLLLP